MMIESYVRGRGRDDDEEILNNYRDMMGHNEN